MSKPLCKRHGKQMEKHTMFDGSTVWTCPRNKCGYRIREENRNT